MKVLFLGATKGMGRALARLMAARGERLHLLGRNPDELAHSAADLTIRGPKGTIVTYSQCDLADAASFAAVIRDADSQLGGCDTAVVTAGVFATQRELESDRDLAERMLTVNFVNTVLFCEELRVLFLQRNGGRLCVFSSIAGERGRSPVVLYGSAKAGVSRYLEGLDHRFRRRGLKTICVKPGFVKTSMTDGLPVPPFAGEPDAIAPRILRAIDRGTPVIYVPRIWALIAMVIRRLPRFVMRRVGF